MELKLRLLADKVPELQKFATDTEPALSLSKCWIGKHFLYALSDEEEATRRAAVSYETKFCTATFVLLTEARGDGDCD